VIAKGPFLAVALLSALLPLAAEADTGGNAAALADTGNQLLNEQFGPFKLSVGQDSSSGGFGANLDGEGRKAFAPLGLGPNSPDVTRAWFPSYPFLGYAATGTWGTAQGATNNASLSLKPGIDGAFAYGAFHDYFNDPAFVKPITCTDQCKDANGKIVPPALTPTFYFGAGASGDLELRYGTFKQNGNNVTARELLIGGQLYAVSLPRTRDFGILRILAPPRVTVGLYHPIAASGTQDVVTLPSEVKANYLQTSFETVIGFGGTSTSTVKLDLKYDGSQPTTGSPKTWQNLYTAKLWVPGLKFNGVNPTVTYQSGMKGGFTYDKQVLIGVLMEFLDPK